ncbi:MAG: hypothetical protein IRD3MM_02340 [Candidatus Midichloria mitochondrii]
MVNKEALVLLVDSKRAFFYKQALNKKITTKLDYELKAKPVRLIQKLYEVIRKVFQTAHGSRGL